MSDCKIDVHHHVYAPFFTKAINDSGGDPSGWYVPDWTIELDRRLCEQVGVKTAILSATAPGPECKSDPVEAAALARQLNKFNAKIRDDDPEHYGFFASVPSLLDTERCLEEIRVAFDEFHADGVILMTRYGKDNHYLGHPDFKEIWRELNRRKAVVFVHPTHGINTELVNKSLPQPMFDYPHETGRTAIDLITSNTFRDYASECKIILSHAGGTLPMLVGRTAGLLSFSQFGTKSDKEIMEEASWFYFDTALSSGPGQLAALQMLAKPDHILFGSDFPNAPIDAIKYFTRQLESSSVLTEDHTKAIQGRAGKKLFPRLAK